MTLQSQASTPLQRAQRQLIVAGKRRNARPHGGDDQLQAPQEPSNATTTKAYEQAFAKAMALTGKFLLVPTNSFWTRR